MNKKIFSFFLFFALVLGLSASVSKGFAQQCNHMANGTNDSSAICCMKSIPGLTDDQKGKILTLHQSHMAEMQKLKSAYDETFKKLGLAVKANNNTDINTLTASLNDITAKLLAAQIAHVQAIRALLTPDQLTKFDASNHFLNGQACGGCCQGDGEKKCDKQDGKKCDKKDEKKCPNQKQGKKCCH